MSVTGGDLNELATEAASELQISGELVSVLDRGELIEKVTGVETGVSVTPDTLFSIGSTTRVLTATIATPVQMPESQGPIDTGVASRFKLGYETGPGR